MEETMAVTATQDTIPVPPVTDTAETAETTPAGALNIPAEDTTPAGEETAPPTATPVTVPVKFRHESRELTLEEAASYAQMGMKLESLQPTMDKLRLMAAGRGQSLTAFVDAWAAAEEQAAMEQLLQKTGGDREMAQRLLRLEQEDRQKACGVALSPEQTPAPEPSTTARLAAQFGELREAFPAVASFEQVPDAVLTDAVQNDRHLLDAYLRYQHGENQKIRQNREAQQAAADASAGSQADHPAGEETDALTEIMRRSIRAVFN